MALLLRASQRAVTRTGLSAGVGFRGAAAAALGAQRRGFAAPHLTPPEGSDVTAAQNDTPWQQWFPYDPKPIIPQYAPYLVHLEQDKEYMWCSCGKSMTQPWNDKWAKTGTNCESWCGLMYVPRTTGYKALSGCKHCQSRPLADMTGFWMWSNDNLAQGSAFMFGSCFVFSVFCSWVFHP